MISNGLLKIERKKLLNTPPQFTGLQEWLYTVPQIWLPHYQVCLEHSPVYNYFSDRYFERQLKTIAWACRSGGKSYLIGLECWMKAIYNPLWEANILAGSRDQAEKSYKATNDFWLATEELLSMASLLQEPPLISVTRFRNGAMYHISTASRKSARGPHQPALYLDEVDEIDVDVFNDAMMQPQSKGSYPASWALCSTMHRVGGLMSDWVDNASARGYKLYTWCILEVMEGCYDYSCSTCIIDKWCNGRMKQVMATAEADQKTRHIFPENKKARLGYNTVEDVISKIQNAGVRVDTTSGSYIKPLDIEADLFCRRPSRVGIVYSEFDDNLHIVDDFTPPDNWPRYRSFDFGYTNPWVCLYITRDPATDRIYIYDEIYVRNKTTIQMMGLLTDSITYEFNTGDINAAGDIANLRDNGISILAYSSNITDGIKIIRHKLMKRPDGKPSLFVCRKCQNTILEISKLYRYPDDGLSEAPIKENDHAMDALRYFMIALTIGYVRQRTGRYA